MTYILAPSRTLSQQLVSRISRLSRLPCAKTLSRVTLTDVSNLRSRNISKQTLSRNYATETGTGKPKAHTGRAKASTRKTVKSKSKTTAKRKAKPAAKPKRAKKAVKPVKRVKKLTEAQKVAKAEKATAKKRRDLRVAALLKAPKNLPSNVFNVLLVETPREGNNVSQAAKDASARYRNLKPEERERLNHIANSNKTKNERARQEWVTSFTPTQIKEANLARAALRRIAKKTDSPKQFRKIQDDRQVKQPVTPYALFLRQRFASGDFKGMKIAEIGPLISREWKALTADQLKPFLDQGAAERLRYEEEFRNVFGKAPPKPSTKPKVAKTTT